MLPRCRWASACGSSAFSAATNWRRVAVGAFAGRGRQTRTMLEASALVGAAYDRAKYVAQRKLMMQTWADYLDQLREGAKVIQLSPRAA